MQILNRRWIGRFCVGLLSAGILAGLAITGIAPYTIIRPVRRQVGMAPPPGVTARQFQLSTGIQLPAWQVNARTIGQSKGIIILLPGITDSKASCLGKASEFADAGFDAISIDHRAHGDNAAPFATFGFFEKYDIQSLVKLLLAERPNRKIGLWGNSYGGAIALQTIAITPEIAFAIIESTFSSLPDIVEEYMEDLTPLRGRWISDLLLARAGKLAAFNPWEVVPAEAARQVDIPILHMHGDLDPNISFFHARRIREAFTPGLAEILTIPSGGHFGIDSSPLYKEAVERFLRAVLMQQ